MSMFTKTEAFDFIKKNLVIENAEEKIKGDRKAFVEEMAIKMQTQHLFQNLSLLSKHPASRRRPTIEEIKTDMLSGIGGLCYNLSVSFFLLLKAIGLNASLITGTCASNVSFPNNHIIVLVSDLVKTGDKYLLDVGFGFPTYRAINLDFEKESPVYIDSFIEYKYIKLDGKIVRMHRKGCPVRDADKDRTGPLNFWIDDWRKYYWLEPALETTDFSDCNSHFDNVFTKPEATPFHGSFRVIGSPNKKAVMVVNNKTLKENNKGDLEVTEIPGGDEGVIATVKTLFPVLPEQLIVDAMNNFREYNK